MGSIYGQRYPATRTSQRRAARFVKKDYHHTTSVTGLLGELGWLPLSECRKHSRLTVFLQGV